MKSFKRHRERIKQRATLAMVLFFCVLISSVEYLPLLQQEVVQQKEIKEKQESQSESETFLNIAVDAVVPFVTVLAQQVFYLIYETFKFDKPESGLISVSLPSPLPYWEILLERIISTNAP